MLTQFLQYWGILVYYVFDNFLLSVFFFLPVLTSITQILHSRIEPLTFFF